ncbi:MAG: tetratricopeptide repeat protein [Candidatus Gastranaerophilales bacterium]
MAKINTKTKKIQNAVDNNEIKTALNSYFIKANALREENEFKQASTNYLNAILIDRNDAEAYYGLGVCYKHLKDYPKAIKYLHKASDLKKDFFEAYYELGICHQLEKIPCGAIKNFVRAIQINPKNNEAILQLGISHEMCEEVDLALMIYQKLIHNSPKFIKGYEHKSTLLMKLGRYKEACSALNDITKINPEYHNAYLGMGVCFEKMNKKHFAQRYYKKFLTKKPFSHKAEFVQSRLHKLKNLSISNSNKLVIV